MSVRTVLRTLAALAALPLGVWGCESDGGGEVDDLCADVACYENATCDPDAGGCDCDEGYENWTDGVGCELIVVDLCEDIDCYANATCDADTGDCVCDVDFEDWVNEVGCSAQPLALLGSWDDAWGGTHDLTEGLWTQGGWGNPSFFHVTQFSNDAHYAVAQNNVHNAWSAGLWSRFDWIWYDAGEGLALYFCQTTYDAASEADALAVDAADATDPTAGGCAGAAWSALTPGDPSLPMLGDWLDDWGTQHTVDATSWTQTWAGPPEDVSVFEISSFDLDEGWLIAQNGADNAWNAGLWSRFDWTWFDAGEGLELWTCQSAYDAASEEDAGNATRADDSDPATSGCGGGSWSRLVPDTE